MIDYEFSATSTDLMRDDSSYQVTRKKGIKTNVLGLGMLLLIVVAPSEAFSAQTNTVNFDGFSCMDIVGHKVAMEQKNLTVPVCKASREKGNYCRLYNSFSNHFHSHNIDSCYLTTFDEVANVVKSFYLEKLYVDIDKKKNLVDFTLNLGNHIVLSVAKNIKEPSENVMFTISYKGELQVADVMSLPKLYSKIFNIQTSLLKNV